MKAMSIRSRLLSTPIVAITSVAIITAGCATTRTSGGTTEVSGGCNPVGMALLGAVLGALVSGKSNRNQGALIGGAVGGLACLGWNYQTKQVKTAEQVNSAYKSANGGQLPTAPSVVDYRVAPTPSSTISSGNPMTIRSQIVVVDGQNQSKPPEIEEAVVVQHDGKSIASAKKPANQGSGAGAYETQFVLKMPEGVPQGYYPVQTALFVDGRQVATRSLSVQIVRQENGEMLAFLQE
jgi:hypothetical protein